jgi:outer membrane autotransporter protein
MAAASALLALPRPAVALDVTGTVVIGDFATIAAEDLIMDGGTLLFAVSGTFDNTLAFIGGKPSTVAAAAGRTVVFDPSFFSVVGIGAQSTATFGSATATGTISVQGLDVASDPTGHVVVAGGTLTGDVFGLNFLLASAGSTTVNAGATLRFANIDGVIHNLLGSGRVDTGSSTAPRVLGLFIDEGKTTEFAGVISGGAQVWVLNTGFDDGTMILSGNNTYSGGTVICACSILRLGNGGASGAIVGDVVNGGTLAFDRSDIYVFDGVITDDGPDAGKVVQAGSGTTVLTADHLYTGTTTVSAGKLVVDGSIAASDTTVQSGATLGGSGTLGNTTVASGGVHAPGNSIGTQTVAGAYTLSSGAVLEIETDASGAADKVVVTGSVSLTGAVLRVLAGSGNYTTAGTAYLIIDNDGADAVNGAFASVTTNLAFLTPSLQYGGADGNDVVLTLTRNAKYFSGVANTPNGQGVAGVLDGLPLTHPVVEAVLGQDEDGARAAFRALSGEVHATLGGLMLEDSRFLREAILARLAQAFFAGPAAGAAITSGAPITVAAAGDSARMALGMGEGAAGRPAPASGLAFWTHAYGAWADAGSGGPAAEADRTLGGFVSGMDAAVGAWTVGIATGYEQADASVSELGSEAGADRYHLAAYAGGTLGPLALRAGAGWTWHDIDTTRAIAFPGFGELAEAGYDGDTGQVFGEVALPLVFRNAVLEPFAGLAYVHVETDAFSESGSVAALRSDGLEEEAAFATLGVRAATTMTVGAATVAPRASAAWRHAFDGTVPGLLVAFDAGPAFGVQGLAVAGDSAVLEAGLDLLLGPNARLGVAYSGQIADDLQDHGIRGSLLWQF